MLDILYELAKSREYASFYSNPESDKFRFGYILGVNEKEIALQELSPDGAEDGVIVMGSERIFRIEMKNQYFEKMQKLCSNTEISEWLNPIDQNNILLSILKNSAIKNRIVSIELHDSGYYATSGFIDQVQNGQCVIRQVDEYGFEDGFTHLLTSDISELEISSDVEKRIQRLWEFNYVKKSKKTVLS